MFLKHYFKLSCKGVSFCCSEKVCISDFFFSLRITCLGITSNRKFPPFHTDAETLNIWYTKCSSGRQADHLSCLPSLLSLRAPCQNNKFSRLTLMLLTMQSNTGPIMRRPNINLSDSLRCNRLGSLFYL